MSEPAENFYVTTGDYSRVQEEAWALGLDAARSHMVIPRPP